MIERSRVVREQDKSKGYWKEMFDPLTNRFWYYQYKSRQNTYRCPLVFQKELVCRWRGYGQFGGDEKICNCVFADMNDYQVHMMTQHKWFCPACDHKNSGLAFPVCSLCENTVSQDGDSGFEVSAAFLAIKISSLTLLCIHAESSGGFADHESAAGCVFGNTDWDQQTQFLSQGQVSFPMKATL